MNDSWNSVFALLAVFISLSFSNRLEKIYFLLRRKKTSKTPGRRQRTVFMTPFQECFS